MTLCPAVVARLGVPSIALSGFWWDVFCLALILMGVHRPLGVVVGILHTFQYPGLVTLISVGEFFDGLFRRVRIL
jgi:hypothetical protein